MPATVLILGTGNAQVDLFEYCRDARLRTVACSNAAGGPGQRLADGFELIDITDVAGVLGLARRVQPDLIYSVGSDVAMPTVCAVSQELSLPHFVTPETAQLCNQKGDLRAFLGEDFRGNLAFQVVSDPHTPTRLQYPLIMKPVDSQGQRGVRTLTTPDLFASAFAESVGFSRAGQVIIEELVDGPEISVNTYSIDGRCVFCVVSDRLAWTQYPGGIIREHRVPCRATSRLACERTVDLVHRVLDRLSIRNGPAYFQIKLRGEEPKLIEATPRLDGCHMWRLLRYHTGIDLLDWTMRHLQGIPPAARAVRETPGQGALRLEFFCEPPGTRFVQARHSAPDALWLRWYYENGETVRRLNGFQEKCGYHISRQAEATASL